MTTADSYLVHAPSYWASSLRIVWLLKEVNDARAKESKVMGWLRDWVREGRVPKDGKTTAGPVAKVSYGLLHPKATWSEWSRDSRIYVHALKSIGWFNMKSLPGGSTTVGSEIESALRSRQTELRADLNALRPQVIIGGNTLQYCPGWLDGWRPKPPSPDGYDSRVISGVVWVNANHPGNRGKGWSHESYFKRIRDAIKRQRPESALGPRPAG